MKKKILVIENAIDVTGSVKSICRSCLVLKDDFDFHFILPTHSRAIRYVLDAGFPVTPMPLVEISRSIKGIFFYLPVLLRNAIAFQKIVRKLNVDLIVVNDFYNMLPSIYKLVGGRVNYITYVRFIPNRFPGILVRIWCYMHERFAARVIAVSKAVLKELPPSKKTICVYNEYPVEITYPWEQASVDRKMILYLSNYIPGKGLEHAINAFAPLANANPEWILRFVGSDMGLKKNEDYKKKLMKLAESLSIHDRIEWNEFSSSVFTEFRQASIFLNFSESESFSQTCMEAMYAGKAVISTRSGGPQEMITNGHNGVLTNLRDVQQMTIELERLIQSRTLRETLGKTAYASIRYDFSPEKTTLKLVGIFHEAIRQFRTT